MRPPVFAELIVGGVIADRDLEHAVLGDLAEEWMLRASAHGSRLADLWYWGQAIRTAPRLLAVWWRTGEGRERSAVWSVLVGYAVMAALTALGDPLLGRFSRPGARFPHPLVELTPFCVAAAVGFASGAAAARVARSAPLATAFVFAMSYFGLWLLFAALLGATRQPVAYWASLGSILPGAFVSAAIEGAVARRQ